MWISRKEKDFPVYNGEDGDEGFLAAWVEPDGTISAIEWYTYSGGDEFWNLNSHNRNELSERLKPTHWMKVPSTR